MVTLDTGGETKPGPGAERLKSDETMEGLAKRVMDAGKPDDWEERQGE